MSKAVSSPTARLLQSSRLFSLPRPLPTPNLETGAVNVGTRRSSDTATLPYPTHQAITTPAASLTRGDWGLKRPLPGKTTRRTSTPHVRIRAQDTSEHIVDFASASDHTQTVRKWQEMGIPMIQHASRSRMRDGKRQGPVSVYEEWLDRTDPDAEAMQLINKTTEAGKTPERSKSQRWKYSGPWLSAMQQGEFEVYLEKILVGKKTEWREFLREHFARRQAADRQRVARDAGRALSKTDLAKLQEELRLNDVELDDAMKRLRDEHVEKRLSSELTALICKFLDLPAIANDASNSQLDFAGSNLRKWLETPENSMGPPSAHPGAGLTHIRTNAIMFNHPIHGPQAFPPPVLARVVRPCTSAGHTTEHLAKIGVGGVVANDSISMTYNPYATSRGRDGDMPKTPYDPTRMAYALDEDMPGGNKMWVHPNTAYVDEKCRIRLDLARADREAIAVRQGDVEEIHQAKYASINGPTTPSPYAGGFSSNGRVPNYGTSLPRRAETPQPRSVP